MQSSLPPIETQDSSGSKPAPVPVRIAIDASRAAVTQRTGVEHYAYELLMAMCDLLRSHGECAIELVLYTDKQLPIALSTNVAKAGGRVVVLQRFVRLRKLITLIFKKTLWTQTELSYEFLLHKQKFNAFFSPAGALPLIAPKNILCTVHDIGFRYFPESYSGFAYRYLEFSTRQALKRAQKVLVGSRAVADDIIDVYKVPAEKLVVAPLGFVPGRICPTVGDLPAFLQGKRYVLFMGRMETRKNIKNLIDAYTSARARGLEAELVLASGDGYGAKDIHQAAKESSSAAHIHFLGYVTDALRDALYANAHIFAFVTWHEGFGMPVLEAQATQVPVITSTVSALPEVAGQGGALFVDPQHTEALTEALCRLDSDGSLRRDLVLQGQENIRRYTWDYTAMLAWKALGITFDDAIHS